MKKLMILLFAIIIKIANGQDNEPTPMHFNWHPNQKDSVIQIDSFLN